jgi:serine/threonine protein phosphatase PrpC
MVLACDGIWDVLSETDVQHIIKYEINKNSNQNNITERMSNTILNSAIANGAWDNLSLFVVKLT